MSGTGRIEAFREKDEVAGREMVDYFALLQLWVYFDEMVIGESRLTENQERVVFFLPDGENVEAMKNARLHAGPTEYRNNDLLKLMFFENRGAGRWEIKVVPSYVGEGESSRLDEVKMKVSAGQEGDEGEKILFNMGAEVDVFEDGELRGFRICYEWDDGNELFSSLEMFRILVHMTGLFLKLPADRPDGMSE